MRICKYPEGILNKQHLCLNCGCKIKLNPRDIGKNTISDNAGSVFVECPVCKNSINILKENSLVDSIYEDITGIIKLKAREIKHLEEGEVKDSLKEFADDLYNKILEGRNNIDGKGI